ncbi:hypothetical protein P389DRAFT_190972 [Cystobasidium minutum MCA 4210]|uniref:uncharacterized protein n=1 Tax=Cystobasidium minutum MCA 4210 TaxID=1397322 RepID=UPI0034CF7A8D|eukprot:jgi/Rhomi1/190972/estExt_fgenesh1_pg.C_60287
MFWKPLYMSIKVRLQAPHQSFWTLFDAVPPALLPDDRRRMATKTFLQSLLSLPKLGIRSQESSGIGAITIPMASLSKLMAAKKFPPSSCDSVAAECEVKFATCDVEVDSDAAMVQHVFAEHVDPFRLYTCPIQDCKKVYSHGWALRGHLFKHFGHRIWECPETACRLLPAFEHIRARHRHRSTNKALTEDEQSSDTTLLQEVHALLQTALIGSIGEIIAQGLQTIFLDLPADAENQMSDMFGEESDFDALAQVLRKVPL